MVTKHTRGLQYTTSSTNHSGGRVRQVAERPQTVLNEPQTLMW